MSDLALVVIEAPGKIARYESLSRDARIAARVVATRGHVAALPDDPHVLGVGADGRFTARAVKPEARLALLRAMSDPAIERVVIATDDDDEGDVIALDVARFAAEAGRNVQRLRLGALTLEAFRAAWARLEPVSPSDAASGLARSAIDRLLGIGLSGPTHGVGRILTPLLALASRGEFRRAPVDVVLPARQEGRAFQGRAWLLPEERERLEQAVAREGLPSFEDDAEPAAASLAGTGELLARLREQNSDSLRLAAAMMQHLYEAGRMSYCRAQGAPLPRESLTILARSCGLGAVPAQAERPEIVSSPSAHRGAHPAPHPVQPIPLATDPSRLSREDAALVAIGRAQAEAAFQEWRRPERGAFAAWLSRLGVPERAWEMARRPVGRLLPWLRPREPGLHPHAAPVETRVLRGMLAHGLGRPSTYVEHAEGLVSRGLLSSDGGLSAKGARWLAAAPAELAEPEMSRRIERLCRQPSGVDVPDGEEYSARVRGILETLPAALSEPIGRAMAAEGGGLERRALP